MLTKNNLPTILILTLLILTIGVLFWHGEKTIQKANNVKSTIIAWENLEKNLSKKNNLNFFIQNLEDKTNNYQIAFLINGEEINSQKIEIKSKGRKIIILPQEVLTKLTALTKNKSSNQPEILYQIKITWGTTPKADQQARKRKAETIGKWLTLK